MNFEATKIALRTMSREVENDTRNLTLGKLPEQGSAGYHTLMQMIERSHVRMSNIKANLKSQAGLLDLQYGARKGGLRDYSTKQIYAAKQANISELFDDASHLAQALLRLYRALHGPDNPGHIIMNGLSSGLQNLTKTSGADGMLSGPAASELQTEIREMPEMPGVPRDFTSGTAIDIFTVCLGLFALIRHKMTRES